MAQSPKPEVQQGAVDLVPGSPTRQQVVRAGLLPASPIPKGKEESFMFFGEVYAQVFETQMFRGLKQLQC